MVAGAVPEAGPRPRRARQLIPAGVPRRGELIAAGGIAILLAHLVLAPVTLVLALAFAVISKVSRWRLEWLLVPMVVGISWVVAEGLGGALAGSAAGPLAALRDLGRAGHLWHPLTAVEAAGDRLAGQLPVALIGGAAEAALIGWLVWLHTDEWALPPPRPGLVAAARRALAARAVRAGAVLTRDGCALGVVASTGDIAELRWAETLHGTLITGTSPQQVTIAGLQVVHAALRRRKPVIVVDRTGDGAIAGAVTAACVATGVPLLDGGSAGQAAADLGRVVGERLAALLPADHAERADQVCAGLESLAGDLGRGGVDSDALVWVPRGELLSAQALAPLLRDCPVAGMSVLIGTTSPAAAAELAEIVGTVLVHRVADQGLAAGLSALTGTRLLPAPAKPVPGGTPGGAGPPDGAPAAAVAGDCAAGAPVLVPSPVIPPHTLLTLGDGQFVLAARSPRPRLVTRACLVPSRLPSRARETPDDGCPARQGSRAVPGDDREAAGTAT